MWHATAANHSPLTETLLPGCDQIFRPGVCPEAKVFSSYFITQVEKSVAIPRARRTCLRYYLIPFHYLYVVYDGFSY